MSVPQNFILRCPKCRWAKMTTGLSEDLKSLREISTCSNCGKPRTFRCPQCSNLMKLTRIKNQ